MTVIQRPTTFPDDKALLILTGATGRLGALARTLPGQLTAAPLSLLGLAAAPAAVQALAENMSSRAGQKLGGKALEGACHAAVHVAGRAARAARRDPKTALTCLACTAAVCGGAVWLSQRRQGPQELADFHTALAAYLDKAAAGRLDAAAVRRLAAVTQRLTASPQSQALLARLGRQDLTHLNLILAAYSRDLAALNGLPPEEIATPAGLDPAEDLARLLDWQARLFDRA